MSFFLRSPLPVARKIPINPIIAAWANQADWDDRIGAIPDWLRSSHKHNILDNVIFSIPLPLVLWWDAGPLGFDKSNFRKCCLVMWQKSIDMRIKTTSYVPKTTIDHVMRRPSSFLPNCISCDCSAEIVCSAVIEMNSETQETCPSPPSSF